VVVAGRGSDVLLWPGRQPGAVVAWRGPGVASFLDGGQWPGPGVREHTKHIWVSLI